MKIPHCPICGMPGSLIKIPVVIKGKRYGPYPAVQHYAGYDPKTRQRKTRVCYIRTRRLDPNQRKRIERLLDKASTARNA